MIIPVNIKDHSYDVIIEDGILNSNLKYFDSYTKTLIVTDDGVPRKYSVSLKEKIKGECDILTLKSGEENKNMSSIMKIIDKMIECNFDRKSCLIALGGGVVGDMVGLASSLYMRGIDFINIPSTFLSMVDSSVGGKTGVDYKGIKNIVGTFHQPKLVIVDPILLSTLDERNIKAGICESLKMAACFDENLFNFISKGVKKEDYTYVIEESIKLKKNVVEKDEKELGLRKVLNFGHTIGHAIEESCSGRYIHGECVGIGMVAISNSNVKDILEKALSNIGLPIRANFDKENAKKIIMHDKKSAKDYVECVIVNKIGSFEFVKYGKEELNNIIDKSYEEET